MSANQAAAQAIQLFSQDAHLCETHRSKMPRTQSITKLSGDNSETSNDSNQNRNEMSNNGSIMDNECNMKKENKPGRSILLEADDRFFNYNLTFLEVVHYLTEERMYEIIDDCEEQKNYSKLIHTLGEVFSNVESLSRSFLQVETSSPIDSILECAAGLYIIAIFITLIFQTL